MGTPSNVKKTIKSLISQIYKKIGDFNSNNVEIEYNIKYNKIGVKYNIPLKKKFENYVFNCIKNIIKDNTIFSNVKISYTDEICFTTYNNNIMFIVIDGYQMPINIYYDVHSYGAFDRQYEGNIKFSIWINDHVAQKID